MSSGERDCSEINVNMTVTGQPNVGSSGVQTCTGQDGISHQSDIPGTSMPSGHNGDKQLHSNETSSPKPMSSHSPQASETESASQSHRADYSSSGTNDRQDPMWETFVFLSKELGPEWEEMGGELGFKNSTLYHIREDNHPLRKAIYHMLTTWKQQTGSEATYEVLIRALQKVKRRDLAEALQTKKDEQDGIQNSGRSNNPGVQDGNQNSGHSNNPDSGACGLLSRKRRCPDPPITEEDTGMPSIIHDRRYVKVLEMELRWLSKMVAIHFPEDIDTLFGNLDIAEKLVAKIKREKFPHQSRKLEHEVFTVLNNGWREREDEEQGKTRDLLLQQLYTFDKRLAKAYADYINKCNNFSVMWSEVEL